MPRLSPAPAENLAQFSASFDAVNSRMGFIPGSMKTMAWKPEMLKAFMSLAGAIMAPGGLVDPALKQMIAYVATHSAGCRYCQAHTAHGLEHMRVEPEKLKALWEYESSPLFDESERSALRFAQLASVTPNGVEDTDFASLQVHFAEEAIAEIMGVIALFGLLNRWNDSLATPLEDAPLVFAQAHLAAGGWEVGKHA